MINEFDVEKEIIKKINTQFQIDNDFMIQNQETFFCSEINDNPFFFYNTQKSQSLELNEINNIMEDNTKEEEEDNNSFDSIYFIKNIKNKKKSSIDLQSTEELTKNLISQENIIFGKKEDFSHKIINFKTVLHHKRGRKEKEVTNKKKSNKYHSSDDFDNIQRKIQVHFFNFLIGLANDILKTFFGKKNTFCFKDIKYNLKKIVNLKYVEYLKQCKYADIIQMKISPKNKKFGENENKNIYSKACDNSEGLKNIFDTNYLYIFQKYYYNITKNDKSIDLDGVKIRLSQKTKGYYDLLEKNEVCKEKFIDAVNLVYFSEVNYLNEKKFVTKLCK